jgi:hypothetical protein
MRFALVSRTLLAPLALIAAAALSTAAPASVGGSAQGRFRVVSPRSTTLEGLVENAAGQPIFRMEALLIGHAQSGVLLGRWTELALDKQPTGILHLEYELVGQYVRDVNGAVRIEAQIFLDLRSQGDRRVRARGRDAGLAAQPRSGADRAVVAGFLPRWAARRSDGRRRLADRRRGCDQRLDSG